MAEAYRHPHQFGPQSYASLHRPAQERPAEQLVKKEAEQLKPLNIGDVSLESGRTLQNAEIAYTDIGNPDGEIIFVCHAFSGDHKVENWWGEVVGEDKAIDLKRYRVITTNVIGGCAGSTGPNSINSETQQPYAGDFPDVSIFDMVHAQRQFLATLGVDKKITVVGGSMGGMQALAWAIEYPEDINGAVVIASTGKPSEEALRLDRGALEHLYNDSKWNGGNYDPKDPPVEGLAAARRYAMHFYTDLEEKAIRAIQQNPALGTDIQGFINQMLDEEGKAFVRRFSAGSLDRLHRAIIGFNLEERHGSLDAAMGEIQVPCNFISIQGDRLYLSEDSEVLYRALHRQGKPTRHDVCPSVHGHDGFLAKGTIQRGMGRMIRNSLQSLTGV